MKRPVPNSLILLIVASVTAMAAYLLGDSQNHQPVQTLFLAFVAAILAIQVIPAMMLFAGMLKTYFAKPQKELER